MRKVCDMCGGIGQKARYNTAGQTDSLNFDTCPMCGGQGYVDDMVYRVQQTNDYNMGYIDGFNAGSRQYLEILAREAALSVNPIFFCHKCGMELGIMSRKEKAHEQKAEVDADL